MANAVQLLCDLAECSADSLSVTAFEPECERALEFLRGLGVVQTGSRPASITCRACDEDHPAAVEFEPYLQRYVYFCPEVGLVPLNDTDLATVRFNAERLADWLAASLPGCTGARLRALVPECIWHLGDAVCGDTLVTVIFARRVCAQADLDRLASALRPIHPADKGLVITTSLQAARQVQLPGGYELLALPEIIRAGRDGLVLDVLRLGYWIRGMHPTTAKGAPTRVGRPSPRERVSAIYKLRRGRGLAVDSDSGEARAILAEWPRQAPDQKPPDLSTVRRHVARLNKARS